MASILVIEDYNDNRIVIELILRDAQYDVRSASDGLSGVRLAVSNSPDVILMDLALPHLDGWEATRRLKANPLTRHIPVIAFTAQLDRDSIDRAVDAGCIAIVAKPFDIDALLGKISSVLPAA